MDFKVIDNGGKEIECEVVTLFKDESNNINYIVYTDGTKNDKGKLEVYASRYTQNGKYYVLEDIENNYEWDLIDNVLSSIDNSGI